MAIMEEGTSCKVKRVILVERWTLYKESSRNAGKKITIRVKNASNKLISKLGIAEKVSDLGVHRNKSNQTKG